MVPLALDAPSASMEGHKASRAALGVSTGPSTTESVVTVVNGTRRRVEVSRRAYAAVVTMFSSDVGPYVRYARALSAEVLRTLLAGSPLGWRLLLDLLVSCIPATSATLANTMRL
jgi:hypothetical protein